MNILKTNQRNVFWPKKFEKQSVWWFRRSPAHPKSTSQTFVKLVGDFYQTLLSSIYSEQMSSNQLTGQIALPRSSFPFLTYCWGVLKIIFPVRSCIHAWAKITVNAYNHKNTALVDVQTLNLSFWEQTAGNLYFQSRVTWFPQFLWTLWSLLLMRHMARQPWPSVTRDTVPLCSALTQSTVQDHNYQFISQNIILYYI